MEGIIISGIIQKIKKILANPLIVISLITVFGALVRLYHLGYKPLWLDEAVIYWISNAGNLQKVITQNALHNSAPPLFVLLISGLLNFGDSEFVLRFIPWLAGVASIPAIYLLSRQFVSKYPAYIASLLVAVAPTQVKYSQELREYSVTFLVATLILIFFSMHLQKPSWRSWIILTLSMAFGVMIQYGLALLIIGLNIIYLYELIVNKENRKTKIVWWISSQVIVLGTVLFVIYLSLGEQMVIGWGTTSTSNYLSSTYWDKTVSSFFSFAFMNTYELFSFAFPGLIFLSLTMVGFIFLILNKNYRTPLLLFLIPTILTFFLALAKLYPYDGVRQDIFLTPMIYMLAVFGISYLLNLDKKRWAIILLLIFLFFGGILSSWNYYKTPAAENLRPVIEILSESFKEGEKIYVYYAAEPAFSYYYRDHIESQIIGTYNRGKINNYYKEIDEILLPKNPVWLVFSHCYGDECKLIPEYISKNRIVDLVVDGNGAYLYYVH